MIKIALTLASIALTAFQAGQNITPPTWTISDSKEIIKAGDEFTITISTDDIDKDWYIYANDFDLEFGPIKAELILEDSKDFTLVGGLTPIGSVKHYDEVFEGEVSIFEDGKAKFTQKIKANTDSPLVKGKLKYQMCSQVTGMCVMFEYEFNLLTVK